MKLDLATLSKPIIAPSLLAANRNDLVNEAKKAEEDGAKFLHIDVMDGKFVPNTSFTLEEITLLTDKHYLLNDVHLMIEEPDLHIEEYVKAGADLLTFHYEALPEDRIEHCIDLIHSCNCYAGISIKPNTKVEVLLPYINKVDLILLMSVEPGKGGQKFLPSSLERLDEIQKMLKPLAKKPLIEIDGGIQEITGKDALLHGAEVLVAGSYLYGHSDMKERIEGLKCK